MSFDFSDRLLIKELKDGSYPAFDKLFARYGKQLYGFVYGLLKNSEDAKEVVQEVFVRVWDKRNTVDEFLSFKTFLFSIAYHHIISEFRKKATEKKYLGEKVIQLFELQVSPDLEVEYKILSERIEEIVGAMPPQRKGIFMMSRYEGLSHAEIAARLNISIKTVENHIALSLRTLRSELGEYLMIALLFNLL